MRNLQNLVPGCLLQQITALEANKHDYNVFVEQQQIKNYETICLAYITIPTYQLPDLLEYGGCCPLEETRGHRVVLGFGQEREFDYGIGIYCYNYPPLWVPEGLSVLIVAILPGICASAHKAIGRCELDCDSLFIDRSYSSFWVLRSASQVLPVWYY